MDGVRLVQVVGEVDSYGPQGFGDTVQVDGLLGVRILVGQGQQADTRLGG